jgi:ABC-type lipoprotein export system ATPase subunit
MQAWPGRDEASRPGLPPVWDEDPDEGLPWEDQAGGLTVRLAGGPVEPSPRVVETCLRFGVEMAIPEYVVAAGLKLELTPGSITLITGPSGSGKSSLLRGIARMHPSGRRVEHVRFPTDVAIVDAVAPTRPLAEAMELLSACGLGEPRLWIRRLTQLSEGERFRARLARAISLHQRSGGGGPLLCDEFAGGLHRRLALAVAFNLRKLVSRLDIPLVVATTRDDLVEDLRPDTVVQLGGESSAVERRGFSHPAWRRLPSFSRDLCVERGNLADYERFALMHYRRGDTIGFVDRVFVMRDRPGGELLGIVIYGRPALELSLRNLVTQGRFIKNPSLLNREMRVLKRLVIHPDVRGCGLGSLLVKQTLPQAETRFVECLASMGAVNPVFERGGMKRIGCVPVPGEQHEAVLKLLAEGVDPLGADFVEQVRSRPAIRRMITEVVLGWYRGATSLAKHRVEQHTATTLAQTFRQLAGSQPVYYLWDAARENRCETKPDG